MPRPKWCLQTRFIHTRVVNGFSGLVIHFASAVRRPVVFAVAGASGISKFPGRHFKKPGLIGSPGR